MIKPGNYPFVRILLPFVVGILLCNMILIPLWVIGICTLITMLSYMTLLINKRLITYGIRWIPGTVIILLFLFTGYAMAELSDNTKRKSHYSAFFPDSEKVTITAVINEDLSETEKSYKTTIDVTLIRKDNKELIKCNGKVLCYFKKSEGAKKLKRGDVVNLRAFLNPVRAPLNPESFDYRRYLYRKGITHQVYLTNDCWKKEGEEQLPVINNLIDRLRNSLMKKVRSAEIKDEHKAIALAILLGFKDDLESHQQQSFAAAGAIHILCVSGLHVGVVFLMGTLLFKPLKNRKKTKPLFFILSFSLIWLFALLTGLSPSVTRASVMLSFVVGGQIIGRKQHVINAVAASAFLLLVFNPAWIFNPGFQLSYLAVTGIILLHKPISGVWNTSNIFLKKLRDLLVVSLVAQLFTAPFAIYYFHQFPNYFLLTNIIVIPLSGIILYAGLLFFVIPEGTLIHNWITRLFDFFLESLNKSVAFIEKIPGSHTTDITINESVVIIIYLFIIFLSITILHKKKRSFFLSLIVINLLLLYFFYSQNRQNRNENLVIYHTSGSTIIDLVIAKRGLSIYPGGKDEKAIGFVANGYRVSTGAQFEDMNNELMDSISSSDSPVFLKYLDWKMLVLGPSFVQRHNQKIVETDLILLHSNPKLSIEDLKSNFKFKMVLTDGSNSFYKARAFEKEAGEQKVCLWNTHTMGAFFYHLSSSRTSSSL